MKSENFSKIIYWIILAIVLFVGFSVYGIIGVGIILIIYVLLNLILFWGKSLGMIGYFIQSFLGKIDLAEKFYKMAIKQKSTTPYALLSYGIILLRRGNTETSLSLFQRASKEKKANILMQKSAITNQALCYWKKGDTDKAIEMILYCVDKFDYINPDTYATLGYLYILKYDYDKAIEYTEMALKDNENHASSLDNMGQIYYNMGELDKAKDYFLKAIYVKSSLVDSQYYIGIIEEAKNNIEEAKKYFEKAYNCEITAFNTVSQEDVDNKYFEYFKK